MRYFIPIVFLMCASVAQSGLAQDGAETGLDVPDADAGMELEMPEPDADTETGAKSSEIKPELEVGDGVRLGVGTMDPDAALPDEPAANVEPPDDKFDLEDPAGGVTLKKSF